MGAEGGNLRWPNASRRSTVDLPSIFQCGTDCTLDKEKGASLPAKASLLQLSWEARQSLVFSFDVGPIRETKATSNRKGMIFIASTCGSDASCISEAASMWKSAVSKALPTEQLAKVRHVRLRRFSAASPRNTIQEPSPLIDATSDGIDNAQDGRISVTRSFSDAELLENVVGRNCNSSMSPEQLAKNRQARLHRFSAARDTIPEHSPLIDAPSQEPLPCRATPLYETRYYYFVYLVDIGAAPRTRNLMSDFREPMA